MKRQEPQPSQARRFWITIFLLLALLVIGTFFAAVLSLGTDMTSGNTALIRIRGVISGDDSGDMFTGEGVSSAEIVRELEQARDDPSIQAVILEINSPGGSAVASDEIAQAVKDVRSHNKTVVAWVREAGASGAYWIASSSDHIIANRMSITGSIGVISSYMQFDQFLVEWNVSYNRLVSGERKDIGDPFTNLTAEQRAYLETKLDKVHEFFIQEIANNRNMTLQQVRSLADGGFFLGVEAKEFGLVDELGGRQQVLDFVMREIGTTSEIVEFAPERGFLDSLLGLAGMSRTPTIADIPRKQQLKAESPVPMLR